MFEFDIAEAFHSDGNHLYTAIGDELVHIEQENILKEIFFRSSSSAAPLFNEGGNSISMRDSYRMSNPNTNSNIYWNIKGILYVIEQFILSLFFRMFFLVLQISKFTM